MNIETEKLFTKVYQKMQVTLADTKTLNKLIQEATINNKSEIRANVYEAGIIRLAIELEAFLSKLEGTLYQYEKKYNHPFQSARIILKREKIYNRKYYDIIHEAWNYYNSLKHENNREEKYRLSFEKKYKLEEGKAIVNYFYQAIINFLKQLKSGINRRNNDH